MKIQADKLGHIKMCFLIAVVVSVQNPTLGFFTAILVGALKEIRDMFGYGTPEWGDFYADVIGATLGAGLIVILRSVVG